jgi:hypothetical protein
MKNAVFWDVTPCCSCKVLTSATPDNIPEDGILQSVTRLFKWYEIELGRR